MSLKKYFEREYNFLQQEGEKFAEKHPGLASELRLSQRQRKDPYVERLFEGFAFLAGRIHERLDDDFPEITGGLLEILFPHFLRPFPSCAILEARPMPGIVSRPVLIKRGSEIQTPTGRYQIKYKVAAGPREEARLLEKTEPSEFIFRTTQDLTVRPMELKEVRVEDSPDASSLILGFQPQRNVDFRTLALDRLVLHLHGAESLKYKLLSYLTQHVTRVSVREGSGTARPFQEISPFKIGIPGLSAELEDDADETALIPYARQVFSGFRLLHEYFAFPEKFFFIALEGLDAFPASKDAEVPFEVKIDFDRRLSPEWKPTARNILLHCSPIVNLFDRSTEEVIVDQRLPEYYILPDRDRRHSREIYSVHRVIGVSENRLRSRKYVPATSYEIVDLGEPEYEFKRFFSVLTKPAPGDMAETYLRIYSPRDDEDMFEKETLSIEEATLSNGFLPAKYLEAGAINQPSGFPPGVEAANLTTPSDVLPCPDRQNFLWDLVSHLTLSYSSLAEPDALKTILSLYNWSPMYNNPQRKKIQAITGIRPPAAKYILRPEGLVRAVEFGIDFDEAQFESGEGEIGLFGTVLSRFLAQYATINTSIILTMTEKGSRRQHTWPPKSGRILPV
jgi:type VI secretion system protein ImpG